MKAKILKWFISKTFGLLVDVYNKVGQDELETLIANMIIKLDKTLDKKIGYEKCNIIKDEFAEMLVNSAD